MKESFRLDFVGVAAPRSGTTWISRCLDEHPNICVSSVKEPHFFLYDSRYRQDLPYLLKQFQHYNNEKLKAEWSNMYLYSRETAQRLYQHNPDMKIIMCLRNPVERAYSQYLNRKYNASIMPLYSFKYIVDHEAKYQYLFWGQYTEHIKYYQTLFSPKNVYIMFYEECVANPQKEIQKLYAFLGVNEQFIPPGLNQTVNDRGKYKYHSLYGQSILNKLTGFYKASRLRPLFDALNLRGILRFLERTNKRQTVVPFAKPPMDPTLRKHLNAYFADELKEMERLLDRTLDIWRKT